MPPSPRCPGCGKKPDECICPSDPYSAGRKAGVLGAISPQPDAIGEDVAMTEDAQAELTTPADVEGLVERLHRLGQRREMEGIYTDQNLCEAAAAALRAVARERDKAKDDLKYYGKLHTEEYKRIRAEALAEQNRKLRAALEFYSYANKMDWVSDYGEKARAALKGEERVRREARLRARLALSGHRGVLRSMSDADRRALAALTGPDAIGRPPSAIGQELDEDFQKYVDANEALIDATEQNRKLTSALEDAERTILAMYDLALARAQLGGETTQLTQTLTQIRNLGYAYQIRANERAALKE